MSELPNIEAAIVERDAGLYRLTLWFQSEAEARKALELLKGASPAAPQEEPKR